MSPCGGHTRTRNLSSQDLKAQCNILLCLFAAKLLASVGVHSNVIKAGLSVKHATKQNLGTEQAKRWSNVGRLSKSPWSVLAAAKRIIEFCKHVNSIKLPTIWSILPQDIDILSWLYLQFTLNNSWMSPCNLGIFFHLPSSKQISKLTHI